MMLQRNLIIIENDILSFYKFIFVGIMNNWNNLRFGYYIFWHLYKNKFIKNKNGKGINKYKTKAQRPFEDKEEWFNHGLIEDKWVSEQWFLAFLFGLIIQEKIIFSIYIDKINRKDVCQKRIFLLTNYAIYNITDDLEDSATYVKSFFSN
jgi:hypothetical protein